MLQTIDFLDIVAEDIKQVEQKMRSGIASGHTDLQAVVDYLIGAGGKRLRPALTLMAAHFYPVDLDKAYALAASVELLHTATLVHDDLIDNSLFRRGMPTLNISWSPGATILTGDFLFARSAQLSAETDNVRIVNTCRNPLDTCLSVYFQQFEAQLHYATDLSDIGHFYLQYRELMAHWQRCFPENIMDIDYDELVREPRASLEPLLAFLQLDWDETCLDFHQVSNRVRTASVTQVRQPLYQHASGRWRNYKQHVQSLRDYFQGAGIVVESD